MAEGGGNDGVKGEMMERAALPRVEGGGGNYSLFWRAR